MSADKNTFEALIDAGEELPPTLKAEILALKEQAIRPLIQILANPDLKRMDDRGGGWAPIHAAALLIGLRAAEAIEHLLDELLESEWETAARDQLMLRLPELGAALLEPALIRYRISGDPDERESLAILIADLEVVDERVYEIILEHLPSAPGLLGHQLIPYGAERALPALIQTLRKMDLEGFNVFQAIDANGVLHAIEKLGGKLGPALQQRVNAMRQRNEQERRALRLEGDMGAQSGRAGHKLGRNDPCWCGSGKKYKRCHLKEEQGARH